MWIPIGPDGGDVRSLAMDPKNPSRVYLGTAGGALYRSENSGLNWRRLVPGFPRRNQNLDEIVVSPKGTLLVGFWDAHSRGGGVAVSVDGGESFAFGLEGESVRAVRLAPSDPNVVIAGSLSGVFASSDGGVTWRRITPVDHPELRNVESVAIDPRDSRVIYVGTWHLPWKTTDGGTTWKPVPRGMIEDSDVFTLTLDRRDPDRVLATACSGIYRTPDGAGLWSRVKGMPFGSRRTRAFAQDFDRPETFYAGTTQGFWVSTDDTAVFRPGTALDVVVNAVLSLPGGFVLAGTEGSGILLSGDRGRTWVPSNAGFSERFVSRIVFDPASRRVLASVWGDRAHGGVFTAPEPRSPWVRLGEGLKGRDVLSLAVAGARSFAGTDQGLFILGARERIWRPAKLGVPPGSAAPRINDLASLEGRALLAATSSGLFRSDDAGLTWSQPLESHDEVTALVLSPRGEMSLAATGVGLRVSQDEGRTWTEMARPGRARVNALAVVPGAALVILAATTRGVYRSADASATWSLGARGLPDSDFTGIAAAPGGASIFVSDFAWGGVYRSDDRGLSWVRLSDDGLVTDRVWTLGLDSGTPGDLLAASVSGGLHLLIGANLRP
jgi:photosystem II stability/assembly factor-like uncharacterized protein